MKEVTVKKAMRGNRAALTDLCRDIAPSVLYRVKRFMPSSPNVEDIAQEVLIRVCNRIRTLKDPQAFEAWLNTIILNEVRTHTKQFSQHGDVLQIDDYLEAIVEEDRELLPLDYTLTKEDSEAVIKVVDTLPSRQREAIVLHYYRDLSVGETAQVMGISQPTASQYLKLAREKIKTEFTERSLQPAPAGQATYARGVSYGVLATLPIGPLLAGSLRCDASELACESVSWTQNASSKAVAQGKKGSASMPLASVVAVAVIVLATLGIFVVSSRGAGNAAVALPQVEHQVVFSGESASGNEHINPRSARVEKSQSSGEFTTLNWEITDEITHSVVACGTSSAAEEPFAALPEGAYRITFTLADEAKREFTSYAKFQILPGVVP